MATDFGQDIAALDDLPPSFHMVSGWTNLAYALVRRLTTPRGFLAEAFDGDPDYGYDLRGLVHLDLLPSQIAGIESQISEECMKDERVQSAAVDMQHSPATQTAIISIDITTAEGTFSLVLNIGAVTTEIILNGTTVTTVEAPAQTTTVIEGPTGPAGPAGAAGAPGGGGASPVVEIEIDGEFSDNTGAEVLVADEPRDFSVLGATLSAQLIGDVRSASGVATFRLRVGGTLGAVDGTVIATITRNASGGTGFVSSLANGGIANPGGTQRVKITMQSSGAAADCGIKDAEASLRG